MAVNLENWDIDLKKNIVNGKHSWLVEYYNESKCGNIIVGHEIAQQLEILIEELFSPDYIYNSKEADIRIEYIEKFCRHTKSPFYGMPFLLELFQKALIESFYSFLWSYQGYRSYYNTEPIREHLRRFKKLILLMARKNGKSSLCSAIALAELMVGPPGSDIVCGSNDDAQAKLIFDETGVMRDLFDPSSRRTHRNLQGIYNLNDNSKIFRLTARTMHKEGRNIDGAILDETHEMVDNTIAKPIEQSQSTKDEPWLINITTEGFVYDGYLDGELDYSRKVLAGDITDPTRLSFLYTQDSENEIWQDERTWQKSNPSLGPIKKISYLKDQINLARHDKGERLFTLTKDFNIKTKEGEAWLMPSELENPATIDMEYLRGAVGIGGVDLSETTDLCCAQMLVMRPGDDTKYILAKYFIPEAKVEAEDSGKEEDKKKKDDRDYRGWARQELVEISPGNDNDYSRITKWFWDYLYKQYNIKPLIIGLDRWNADYLIRELTKTGFDCEKVSQNMQTLSNPMKLVEADLKSKTINYDNNPITRWCLSNTGIKVSAEGLIYPVKPQGKDNKRIDGAVTMIITYCMYQKYKSEYMSLMR